MSIAAEIDVNQRYVIISHQTKFQLYAEVPTSGVDATKTLGWIMKLEQPEVNNANFIWKLRPAENAALGYLGANYALFNDKNNIYLGSSDPVISRVPLLALAHHKSQWYFLQYGSSEEMVFRIINRQTGMALWNQKLYPEHRYKNEDENNKTLWQHPPNDSPDLLWQLIPV